jgi:hypothetical protein
MLILTSGLNFIIFGDRLIVFTLFLQKLRMLYSHTRQVLYAYWTGPICTVFLTFSLYLFVLFLRLSSSIPTRP